MTEATATPQSTVSTVRRPEVRNQLLEKLQQDLQEAEEQVKCQKALLNGQPSEHCFDRLDQAALINTRYDLEVQLSHLEGKVEGIKQSIERVRSDQFALCQDRRADDCTGEIEIEKLQLSPAARQCIKCTLKERQAKTSKPN